MLCKDMDVTCVICLDDMTTASKRVEFDGCNHSVHSSCFFAYTKKHLETHNRLLCPVCRTVVLEFERHTQPHHYLYVTNQASEDATISEEGTQCWKIIPKLGFFILLCGATVWGVNGLLGLAFTARTG